MSRLYSCVMGSLDVNPYTPRNKCDPLSVAGAGLTALGGVANSLLGGLFGSSANKKNIELQRETNRQNYQMFKEQQAFNLDMWNKQNAYNDPSAQVDRLLKAGINPSAVFGNGSLSEAGTLTSPDSPQMVAPHVNPYQPDLRVGEAVNAYMQNEMINAQKKKLNADTAHTEALTLFEQKSMDSRLRSLQSLARRDDALGDMAKSELRYMQDSYYWRLKSLRNDIVSQEDQHRLTQEQIYNHKLQNGLAEVQLAYAPRLNEAQLKQYYATVDQLKAQISLINSNKMLTDEQRLHEIEKKAGSIIDNNLKQFDLNLKNQVRNYIVSQYKNSSYLLGKDVSDYEANWWNRTIQGYIPFASGSATQASKKMLGY